MAASVNKERGRGRAEATTVSSVLVVDDEALAAMQTASALSEQGYLCRSASTKEECLELLSGGYRPDAILMDIYLGESKPDGVEAAEEIYARWDIPVVFFTGYNAPEIIDRTTRVPRYGCIQKCSGNERLLANAITTALSLHRRERRLQSHVERYRSFFDNAPLGIFRSTPEGRFLDLNQSLAEILGYASPQEVMDEIRDIGEQLYVRESERAAILNAAEEGNGILHFENIYRRRDGSHFTAKLYLTVVRDREGTPLYLEGMIEDISRRKEIEEELRRQKHTLTSILEHTSDVVVRSDLEQRHIYANPQLYQHTGLSPDEYLGATNEELNLPAELCERLRKTGEAAIESGKPQKITFAYDTVDMGRRWFHATTRPEYDEHGKPVSLLSFIHDVTELQEARTQLEEREGQLRSVFAALQEGVLVYDTRWKLLFSNDRAPEILGCSREQLRGGGGVPMRSCCRLLDRSGEPLAEEEHPAVHTLRSGESCRERVLGIERGEGDIAWLSFNAEALKLDEEEEISGVVVSFRDITREERYTRQLKELADTKEHLLVEINHRVKNNLLTVEALANLERYDPAKDKEEALQDIVNRIRAISLVHQKLYTTGQFASLHAGAYLRELVDTIVQTHANGTQDCPVRCDVNELRLPPKRLTTLGLIVSELLNNTVKHAGCPAGAPVSIALNHREGRAVLDYRDSGPGLPRGISSVEELASGTGMRLVGMLVSDMDGEISVNPEAEPPAADDAARTARASHTTPPAGGAGGEKRGVHFRISFPLD